MVATERKLILPLPRGIRSDQGLRLRRVERRTDGLHEGSVTMMGLAGLANVATGQHGDPCAPSGME